MAEKNSKQVSATPKTAASTTTVRSYTNHPTQRIVQNFLLIWIDESIDQSSQDLQNTLAQLRSVVNDVNIFTDTDECVDFLTEIDDVKTFMIVEGTIAERILPLIHEVSQLDNIYIFCDNKSRHEHWIKRWIKVTGVYTQITPICEALQLAVKQCNHDFIAVSFVPMGEGASSQQLDQLEPSFMYTQIFKEILLEITHDEKSIKLLVAYCREKYADNIREQSIIDEFERDYHSEKSIWWYTRECFTYQILNRALRTLEGNTIINMGFFISDLHRQLELLYQQQISSYHGKSFTVYRGQGFSTADFDKIMKTKGGLMSFNNFLSTSEKREVSLKFAERASKKSDMVGILFEMFIDPSISSTPFAAIDEVSYYKTEKEVLFSMHTVFRIVEVKTIDNNSRLYQVDLKLTADDDQQLRTLTKQIREKIGGFGYQRMGPLLSQIGQFDSAEELYKTLLDQTFNEVETALYYNNLGFVKCDQGDYQQAISLYQKSLEICEKTLPPNHHWLAVCYSNIGLVYLNIAEYLKALSFYEKSLNIREKALLPDDPDLANSYGHIGAVYDNMGEYSKALSFYEKSLEIQVKTLPPNDPSLATSYNNVGLVYRNMGEYLKALPFYEKSLEIREKTLPPNHPYLAVSYNNIGSVYLKMGEYSKALSFYEKSIGIQVKTLPPNHPSLATSYNNIGAAYDNMGEYSRALPFHEKALEIREKTLPSNHPGLATSCSNIGAVYGNMGEYSKSLSFWERALSIFRISFPSNHPNIRTAQKCITVLKTKL